MSNVNNTSKGSAAYHLKKDLQFINSILQSNHDIITKCVHMWPHIDNLCVYEEFVNPEKDSTKKNSSKKLESLNTKMKEYQITNNSKDLNWNNLTYEQSYVIYGLFVDVFFGVM